MPDTSMIKKVAPSNSGRADTPPNSPTLPPSEQMVTFKHVQQFMEIIKIAQATHALSDPVANSQAVETQGTGNHPSKEAKTRASKLEFKTVDEVWDATTSNYKIVESLTPISEVNDLDEYIFVARMQVDKKTENPTYFIDLKSEALRDIRRTVLQNVKGICLREDKPTVEQNLLYHYLPKLKAYGSATDDFTLHDSLYLECLNLLMDYIESAYISITLRLISLLDSGEITYDLLWTLFKPNTVIYGKCLGTKTPRCIKCDLGEKESVDEDNEYFYVEGRYLDFNGKLFGKALTALGISKFRGAKPINSLEAYPFQYHQSIDEETKKLVNRGRKFISLMGIHYQQYQGNAFFMDGGNPVKIFVNGRIVIDAAFFRELNPNYIRPRINELRKQNSSNSIWYSFGDLSKNQIGKIKANSMEPARLNDDELLHCSPTVLGFSFGDKLWRELVFSRCTDSGRPELTDYRVVGFGVADISDISWNPLPFQCLAIPFKQKKLIQALAVSHLSRDDRCPFDDFVAGKGCGLIMLLHGPPGVGKTWTAEGLSEHLKRPLYTVSCGELGSDLKQIEDQLSSFFRIANHWDALLLLDEADVFLQQRSLDHGHNAIVSIFLRKLEYYEGIMFLTTNRVKDFDDAMQSRIHLAVKYPALSIDTRKEIWKSFLEKTVTSKGKARLRSSELDKLAEKNLNGRQIKNAARAANALASQDEAAVSYHYLKMVLELGEEFECNFKGSGRHMSSYS